MQYGDCSCHNKASTATIAMSASKTSASPSEQITVTVTVTGGQGTGGIMGALILSKLSGTTGTLPSDAGWTIVSDPAGTRFNYVERSGYTGSMTFTWTVKAPAVAGTYTLYSKIEHGPSGYTKDYTQGLTFTVAAAVSGPSISITSPANGATISGSSSLAASVSAGSSAVSSVQLAIDGVVKSTLTASPWTFAIDTTSLTNGQHTLAVTATDANAKTASASITVTVNNAPLAVSITSPANGASVKGTVTLSATATGPAAISYVAFFLDGVQIGNDTSSPYSVSLDTTRYTDGQHTLSARAVDSKSSAAEQKITVVLNNTGTAKPVPAVTITSPSNGQQVSGTVAVNATVTSSVTLSKVTMTVDGVLVGTLAGTPYQWSLNTNSLSNGQHVLNITATDTSGTVGYMSITVNVQNQALQLTLRSPANGTMSLPSFNVTGDILFGTGQLTVKVLDAGNQIAGAQVQSSFSVPVSGLSLGQHTVTIVVSDATGRNVSSALMITVVRALPTISVTFPSTAAGVLKMNATVDGPGPVTYVVVKVDGVELANMSSAPFAWSIDTGSFAAGAHDINITASFAGGLQTSRSAQVLFQAPSQAEGNTRWQATTTDTIIGFAIAMIALLAIMTRRK
jgi:spore germination cell wall hydrolase CwlJ-like protein